MKYYPVLYNTIDDLQAALRGEPMTKNELGYLVVVKQTTIINDAAQLAK